MIEKIRDVLYNIVVVFILAEMGAMPHFGK